MTTLNTTELTEEDAADLQFPKEIKSSNFTLHHNLNVNSKCSYCENELSDTFILCVQCDINICTSCFANGREFDSHKNDHAYKVLNHDFNLFEYSDWTAKEELVLLNGLMSFSNWQVIAQQLPNRSIKDIKYHYNYYYLQKYGSDSFPSFKLNDLIPFKEPIVPYRFRLNNVQEPLRNDENNPAGYNAARSDFEYEYDKGAEDVISGLETIEPSDPYCDILSDLQASIINTYRRRVWERQRRKRIIREHGLIMPQKTESWLNRFNLTVTPLVYEKLIRFMQFYTGQGFEYLLEGLHRAGELKIQISRLCEFRKKGIKSLEEAQLYMRLRKFREDSFKEIKSFQNISELNVKIKNVSVALTSTSPKRRSMTPLEIGGMCGYEKLLSKERELCRLIRLPPLNYLELKSILIAENNKLGFLKLLTARTLLKIDVNKTRKLYDFLVQEGYVKKPK